MIISPAGEACFPVIQGFVVVRGQMIEVDLFLYRLISASGVRSNQYRVKSTIIFNTACFLKEA
ncbi:hypothetical protein [Jeotgalibacillus soli]|uniref:Uncharacterized protein n=1 Tax=Jeotgalibacillus soli TaxID=889306 RepID=A0A0C2VZB0_9BACL|nr:hypothetical protein [Jeotgalibacillus soli]KIL49726.1 hypothetical protein KP78_11940 [Jeotgalibacillus soli]